MNDKDMLYSEISSKFNNCPELPDKLKKENVVSMLKGTSQEKTTKITFKRIGSVAAIFAIVLISVLSVVLLSNGKIILNEPDTTGSLTSAGESTTTAAGVNASSADKAVGSLKKAQSREEIEKIILKNYNDNAEYYDVYNKGSDFIYGDNYNGASSDALSQAFKGLGFSQTNTQTLGIDEGDIIKNDGRYLYVISFNRKSSEYKLKIIDTVTMALVCDTYFYNNNEETITLRELYLIGDKLIVVATYGDNYYGCCVARAVGSEGAKTITLVVDVTDKSDPKVLRRAVQDGDYISSRMSDGVLYVATEYYVFGEDEKDAKENSVPKINGHDFAYDCIYITDEGTLSYICLSAYDTSDIDSDVSTLAILGDGYNVYCSESTFYVVGSKKSKDSDDSLCFINAFSLDGTKIALKAQVEVRGFAPEQYNMDEYNGTFRIAVNSYDNKSQKDLCSLYILDNELKVIGKLENIADNEIIQSVRYMGDKAYIVTYKNTDPLFAIDLKDPTKPKIIGEIKLPGYSGYLHPISENIILGIGYNGNDESADFTSMKVSLFDVSDMSNPKEISTFTENNATCCVTDDPKAFVYNVQENYIALPVEKFGPYGLVGYGCYIISLKDNKVTLKYKFDHPVNDVYADLSFIRGAYIDSSFFTVSDNLVIKYSLVDGTKQGEIKS